MLATGALVASLLAVGAGSAGADTDTVDNGPPTMACVGPALNDHMFTDVSDDHAFKDAINCVAYYGVTNGTGDGSTYSPNQEVTRAEMAVFIARAAEAAGVDLGDAMSAGFTDIGDVWAEAQDAINRLASKGMISSGGAFRPDDAITRAEMASFLVGLLVKATPNVDIPTTGANQGKIMLGTGSSAAEADDWFADSRAALPRSNDAEVSAIYELGVTKGASPAAVQDDTKPPLDYNYEPHGTVNRGQMAAFITRALAHTSVRPEGITAQYDSEDDRVVVSARDENFMPRSNVVVDVFSTDTGGAGLAFHSNGTCRESTDLGGSTERCEIDGADPITGGDGDTTVALATIAAGGTTVWAWTGKTKDTVDSGTDLYRLDIPEGAETRNATHVRVSTEYPGNKKAHLGSSVLYTVQLEDAKGPVQYGVKGKKPAKFLVQVRTFPITPAGRSGQGASVVSTIPLTTDGDGEATFRVAGLPDQAPGTPGDKYAVDIKIQAIFGSNAPGAPATATATGTSAFYIGAAAISATAAGSDTDAAGPGTTGLVPVRVDDSSTTTVDEGLVFSTEPSSSTKVTTAGTVPAGYTITNGPGVTISVKSANDYVASDLRGASNRATVTVTDQYGDPIRGARVSLTSTGAPNAAEPTAIVIGGGRFLAVGRDGSYTFGYTRANSAAATETLTPRWDHDGDGCTTTQIADTTHRCNDLDGSGPGTDQGTPGVVLTDADGNIVETVQWALAASTAETTGVQVRAFDTDTNTIFVDSDPTDATGSALVVNYDSNDRFNISEGGGTDVAKSYAEFEKALSTANNVTLEWTVILRGSRSVNTFTLNIP